MSTASANPSTFWTGTTWQAFATGKTIVGIDTSDTEFNTVNKTGGSKNVTLATNQLPSHSHNVGDNTHNHSIDSIGDHAHTVNNHTHYIDFDSQHPVDSYQSQVAMWRNDQAGHSGDGYASGTNYSASATNWALWMSQPHWHRIAGHTNGSGAIGMTGAGAHNHSMTAATHSHSLSNTGNNEAHNNLPPYIVTYMWKRIS